MAEAFDPFTGLIFFIALWSIRPNLRDSKNYLKSIDEKMHTHAADGSIQGIGGWY